MYPRSLVARAAWPLLGCGVDFAEHGEEFGGALLGHLL